MAIVAADMVLRFSHNVIEHLGVKLYQNKPTNVLAELVSNAWDANAGEVRVYLRSGDTGAPESIAVVDSGDGMSSETLANNYLVVGQPKDRPQQQDGKRFPMGRKGIGKLAPFGVARTVDVITAQDSQVTWLRFNYSKILEKNAQVGPSQAALYAPDVVLLSVPAQSIDVSKAVSDLGRDAKIVADCLTKYAAGKSGTAVLCRDLTLRRPIVPSEVEQSLGRRFTVTLLRDDFRVSINDVALSEKVAFPQWELRIPETGFNEDKVETSFGQKTVKHWVGFVKTAAWSSDQAGVGVYAHGKIAQDRPYTFGDKGNEIFSRYMYGVVEADWVDELDHDTISTDRTSIDWDDPELSGLHRWGQDRVRSWMNTYQAHRSRKARDDNREAVNKIGWNIRESEKEHLLDILQDVTPKLPNDDGQHNRLIEAAVKAWVHDPARRLINKLWKDVAGFDPETFATTVNRLADELVPESLSLGVAFAQRVFALTQLHGHILEGKETQLQQLIESFPWILNDQFERFTARKSLRTIVDDALQKGELERRYPFAKMPADRTQPDFVFFGVSDDSEILVVELKGPGDTAQWEEAQQLTAYVNYLLSRFNTSNVRGILVAGSIDQKVKETLQPNITFEPWNDVLLRSRRAHAELLRAMLVSSDPGGDDARVKQIYELGGAPVKQFLEQMSEKDSVLRELITRLKPVIGTPTPPLPNPDDK